MSTVQTGKPTLTALNASRILPRAARLTALVCALLVAAFGASAQSVQHTENKADLALKSDLRVDPSTLGMSISIPLASYPGRAGLSLPVAVTYSSKVLRLDYRNTDSSRISGMKVWTQVEFAEHSTAGWTSTLGAPRVEFTGLGQYYNYDGRDAGDLCEGEGCVVGDHYVKRINVHMPDGSTHELRRGNDDVYYSPSAIDKAGQYYAVDGSRLRYDTSGGSTGTLYLPGGSRYELGTAVSKLWQHVHLRPCADPRGVDRHARAHLRAAALADGAR